MTDIILGSLPDWVNKWGPLLLIILAMLYIGYKLALKVLTEIGRDIVGALEKPSEALTMQAKSMDRLTNSLEQFVCKDQSEHREIIILQKVILEKIENLRSEKDGRDEKRAV